MRKAARHLGGMVSLNPRRWTGERLHHHGGGVCWLFVLLWMDSWRHKLIICKKWYKNNLKMSLMALLFDPPRRAPHLMWFCKYYFFKLLHENYTLFSLNPLFSNLTFVYFWDVVSHHLHLLPQYHQSHLHLACLLPRHLRHLPHIFPQVPLIPQLNYHLWHNVSFDTITKDLEVYSIHHLT